MDAANPKPLQLSKNLWMRYCCVFSSVFFGMVLLSSFLLCVLLVLKPKRPVFHLLSIHMDPIKLDVSPAGKQVFLPALMASLLFLSQNDNKFGIRYGPANLGLIFEGDPIGVIEVPGFYQPPNGTNATLITHVMLKRLDISRFVLEKTGCVGEHPCDGKPLEVQIVGMVRAGIHVNNFSFPRLKICIDCKIKLDYFTEIFRKGMLSTKGYKALVLSKLPHFSQESSLYLCL